MTPAQQARIQEALTAALDATQNLAGFADGWKSIELVTALTNLNVAVTTLYSVLTAMYDEFVALRGSLSVSEAMRAVALAHGWKAEEWDSFAAYVAANPEALGVEVVADWDPFADVAVNPSALD